MPGHRHKPKANKKQRSCQKNPHTLKEAAKNKKGEPYITQKDRGKK